jgi:ubiquinone/menaquinone biosynthesis C-methylase UbiE
MTTENTIATQRYFDTLAGDWDNRMVLDEQAKTLLTFALKRLDIEPGHRVIDAGCGTGILYPLLGPIIGELGSVVGIDLAAAMVENARRKHGVDSRFEWVQGDIVEVLHRDWQEQAERIVCFSAFPHFANKSKALQAFYRALRPGGRFAVLHLRASSELNRFHAGFKNTPVCRHRLPPARKVARLARKQGFHILWREEQWKLYSVVGEKPR